MHALVTGGGGFLGLYIVEQLRARGARVSVFCRNQHAPLERLDVEVIRGDVRDAEAVRRACQGVDTVFHAAAMAGIWGPWRNYHGINTVGTRNVIAACLACGTARLVYTSSPSVVFDGSDHLGADESLPYPRSYLCPYPHTKALAEQAVLAANGQSGLLTVALRPHLIWGPRDNHLIPRLIARARAGKLKQIGAGNNLVSISYVENAAAAHLQAADALATGSAVAGQAFFVNEEEPVNLWQWIRSLLLRAGLEPPRGSLAAPLAYAAGAFLEWAYLLGRIQGEPPMTRFLARQLAGSHHYSILKAKRAFGLKPLVSVSEGLNRIDGDLKRLGKA
jgi:nucleoside-diphosphate-sugar epimerase